ncbi:MAG: site-specific integrase [Bacteroidales bacterium]|nr:site-specific integrase [Bacteroidales bacterium]
MSYNFQQVACLWKAYKQQFVKESSFATYLMLCNKYILPCFGTGYLPQEQSVQDFITKMLDRGFALKTVKDVVLVLKMIVRYGEKLGAWSAVSYAFHYPAQMERPRQVQTLSPAHTKKLLKHLGANLSSKNLGLLICIFTGLRIGEICGLQWKDVDLRAGVIRVNKTVQRIYLADGSLRRYYLSVGTPKTLSSVREIPLPARVCAVLKPIKRDMQPENYLLSGCPLPLEPRTYRDYYHRLLKELGLPRLRFHALRHSFATRCIDSRCDYKTVSSILGHASIATTMNLYVHPDLSQKRKCVERVAKGWV